MVESVTEPPCAAYELRRVVEPAVKPVVLVCSSLFSELNLKVVFCIYHRAKSLAANESTVKV